MHVYELISSLNEGINVIRHFLMFVPILLHCESSLPKNTETSRKLSAVAMLSSAELMILFSWVTDCLVQAQQ